MKQKVVRDRLEEEADIDFNGKVGAELLREMYKRLKDDLKKELELMKGNIGKRGEELDKKKYIRLMSEYRNFKKHNVRHFRFNSAANSSNFGTYKSVSNQQVFIYSMKFKERSYLPQRSNWFRFTLTRRPLTTSRGTRRSRWRPS